MSVSNLLPPISVVVGEAIPIYRFMQLQADGKYDVADDAQGLVNGVSAEAAAADLDVIGMELMLGIAKVEAGAATTLGALVGSDTTGRAIDHVTTAGNYILGNFLDAAGAAGDIVRVQLALYQDGA